MWIATPKPFLLPDTISGSSNSSWDQWIVHFDNCEEVNVWEAAMKLSFLKVWLIDQTQIVFQRLSKEDKSSFNNAVVALTVRFKPESKRELYLAEFSTRECTGIRLIMQKIFAYFSQRLTLIYILKPQSKCSYLAHL